MERKSILVMIADDTLIAREGWKKILETVADMQVVGEAETAQETPQEVRELRPDVLLMDLKWHEDSAAGMQAIAQVKRDRPETKIVAITAYPELIAGARKAGADGVLTKGFSREELVSMVRAVHQMNGFPLPSEEVPLAGKLTKREREVLPLMAEGLTDRQIADRLVITESTAKNHVRSILSKLGASNRAQAVSIAYEKDLLT
jgi:NarL family two-component system response regulator LiaR